MDMNGCSHRRHRPIVVGAESNRQLWETLIMHICLYPILTYMLHDSTISRRWVSPDESDLTMQKLCRCVESGLVPLGALMSKI